jgi:hypothetical protein
VDSLPAGTLPLILLGRVHCAGYDVQRRRAFENIPGIAKTIPDRAKIIRLLAAPTVRLQPGIVLAFIPESC